VAASIVVAGYGTSESGIYFGYNGTSFGLLHVTGGVREIHTLTVTTASTATNEYVVTLPDTSTVTVTATNNGSTTRTAYEISLGTFPGWTASAVGATVVFLASDAGPKSGTFSLAQTGAGVPAAGADVETVAGVASTDTWVPQSDWNGDRCDGTDTTRFQLDPSKGNVFQIGVQYLGFGTVTCQVEVPDEGGNNADFVTCHTFNFPNSRTGVTFTQPSFPFTMTAYSAGSTTNVAVSVASFAGFIEGEIRLVGPRGSFQRETNGLVGSTASTYYPLFSIRNGLTVAARPNQAVVRVLSLSASHDDATPVAFALLRNPTLVGPVNFSAFSTNSVTEWDQGATTCTVASNEQIETTLMLGQSGGGNFPLSDAELLLQPGEVLTLAARAVTGTATYVLGSVQVREDQ